MAYSDLLNKLAEIREEYTLPIHKREMSLIEQEVRKAIIRKDLQNHAAIKDLIAEMEKKILRITLSLAWDRELLKDENKDQRERMFVERDCYCYLLAFFTDPDKVLASVQKKVEEEIENLKEQK